MLIRNTFEDIISKPRLNSYKCYFNTQNTDEAIGLYLWNCELSACFNTLLSFFEIVLRNHVHHAMSQFYGKANSYHWYDKIGASLKPDTISKIEDIRYDGFGKKRKLCIPAPTPDEIISRVTFGFWPAILGSIDRRYADQLFPKIFPFHPLNANPSDWNDKIKKKQAVAFIYELNSFRNRIAHHEPLWKFAAIKDTSNQHPVVVVPESKNLNDSLVRFARLLDLIDEAIKSMNTPFYADILQSSWRQKLDYLLTQRGIARYKALKHCSVPPPLTPLEFQQKFALIVQENQPVRVESSNMKGLFTPE